MDDARSEPREPALIAPAADQLRLLDVQRTDTRLDQIAHAHRTLPGRVQLAELSQRERGIQDRLTDSRAAVDAIKREVSKADADVEQVRRRAERDRARLDAGQGSPKELESLQHELGSLARRQGDLEDLELDAMERLEAAIADVGVIDIELSDITARIERVSAALDAAVTELDVERRTRQQERAAFADGLDAGLLELYEKVRTVSGTGAAQLRSRRCEGCRLELTPQDLQRIRAAAADHVVRCEECRRILVRTPESGL
ncbi:MAG: zinc ribbon domain-containing protein [Angustibacter sp.]